MCGFFLVFFYKSNVSSVHHISSVWTRAAGRPAYTIPNIYPIYTQYMSQPQTNIKSRPIKSGGLGHASISNVVALFVCQERYRPLDLCLRVLLGLLDLRVVLAQDRRVLPRGNGDATLFTWTV